MSERQVIKRFEVEIETLSPVHIGSGDILTNKLANYDANSHQLTILSLPRLQAYLLEHPERINRFISFCDSQRQMLPDLLREWSVSASQLAAYQLHCARAVNGDVRAFIRGADGMAEAYVPGSSLKGALRSAIARALFVTNSPMRVKLSSLMTQLVSIVDAPGADMNRIKANERRRRQLRQEVSRLIFVRKSKKAERGDDSNYDLMRYLQVGDSAPFSDNSMLVCAVDVMTSRVEPGMKVLRKKFNTPTYIESIAPHEKTHCNMRLLTMLNQSPAAEVLPAIGSNHGQIDQLWAPCRSASRNLIEQEIAFYQYHAGEVAQEMLGWFSRLANQVQASSDDTCMLPLGWGSGYDAKTVTDLVEDTLFEQVSNRSRFTHRLGRPGGEGAWLHSPLVPKTRKVVVLDGQYYPMGWVKLVRRA